MTKTFRNKRKYKSRKKYKGGLNKSWYNQLPDLSTAHDVFYKYPSEAVTGAYGAAVESAKQGTQFINKSLGLKNYSLHKSLFPQQNQVNLHTSTSVPIKNIQILNEGLAKHSLSETLLNQQRNKSNEKIPSQQSVNKDLPSQENVSKEIATLQSLSEKFSNDIPENVLKEKIKSIPNLSWLLNHIHANINIEELQNTMDKKLTYIPQQYKPLLECIHNMYKHLIQNIPSKLIGYKNYLIEHITYSSYPINDFSKYSLSEQYILEINKIFQTVITNLSNILTIDKDLMDKYEDVYNKLFKKIFENKLKEINDNLIQIVKIYNICFLGKNKKLTKEVYDTYLKILKISQDTEKIMLKVNGNILELSTDDKTQINENTKDINNLIENYKYILNKPQTRRNYPNKSLIEVGIMGAGTFFY